MCIRWHGYPGVFGCLIVILFLLFQPSTATNKAGLTCKKRPALDLAEFLRVCVLPHVKIVPEGHSQGDSVVSCGLALALLRVALETPAMQLCDWTTVVRCRLFPTILCVCSVVDVCGCLYVDYTRENLYTVKETAVELIGMLTRILSRQQSSRTGACNLFIIELTMSPCVAGRVCGNRLLKRLMSPLPKSRAHSHESVIFSFFWHSYFLRYGQFLNI